MLQVRRSALAVGLAAVLALTLTGCQFLGDVAEGQRIASERLNADSRLRALVGELDGLAQVEHVEYSFDAADVETSPAIEVQLSGVEFDAWNGVVAPIEEAVADDALAGFTVDVTLHSGEFDAYFQTSDDYTPGWFDAALLATASDAGTLFPGARVSMSGGTGAGVSAAVGESAEELLARVSDDPAVVRLTEAARDAGHWLGLATDGLDVNGTPSPETIGWAGQLLAHGALTMAGDGQDEWGLISVAGGGAGAESISANWAANVPAADRSPAWLAFVAAVRLGPVVASDGTCVPIFLGMQLPGSRMVSASSLCGEPGLPSGGASAEQVEAVADALAAEGVVAGDFGFTLS